MDKVEIAFEEYQVTSLKELNRLLCEEKEQNSSLKFEESRELRTTQQASKTA
jgi:hypothetical protein